MSATAAPLQDGPCGSGKANHGGGGKDSRSHLGHKAKGEPWDPPGRGGGGSRGLGGKAAGRAGATGGAQKGKAYGSAQKGKAHTIARWAEERDRAVEAAAAAELSCDRHVGAFFEPLLSQGASGGPPAPEEPLDIEGKLFYRSYSLVSVGMVLPLKIAKGLRHGLKSASEGGLRSVKFFELPNDAVRDDYAQLFGKPMTLKIATETALAAVVFNTQRESEEAVEDIHKETLRLKPAEVLLRAPGCSDRQEHATGSEENGDAPARRADSGDAAGGDAASTVLDDVRRIQRRSLLLLRGRQLSQYGEIQPDQSCFRTADARSLRTMMRQQRELDDAFRRLLEPLPLQREELEECARRGLDEGAAESCGFKTWPGGVLRGVPALMPAAGGEGGPQAAAEVCLVNIKLPPGLLIPARNVEGLITGLQLRSRACPEGDLGGAEGQASSGAADTSAGGRNPPPPKYLWVSKDKSVKGGASGENMPFFCVCLRWSCRTHTVALVEGGLKAYVFAFLARRYPVIGASGGQWHNCGEPLLHALARLSARELLLFVDAGAVQNKLVLLDYFRSFRLLQVVWGLPTKFVWWGQTEKAVGKDCDEQVLSLRSADPTAAPCLGHEASLGAASATEDGADQSGGPWHTAARSLSAHDFWRQIPHDVQLALQRIKAARTVLHDLRYWLNIGGDCKVSTEQVRSGDPAPSDAWGQRVLGDLMCSGD